MSVYGGYDPGTFQAWALNLFTNIFVKAGIARGMSVTQTATPSMAVLVNLDPTANDGVVYLANGCWLRIDAQQTFSIGANSSGSTRTDALVATVDPSGTPAPSLTIQANWPNGFTAPSANEFVVALISVANGASSILNANITLNSATASVTASGGSSNSMTASDGVGLSVQDSSASSVLSVVLTGLTTGEGRAITIQATDSSAIGHQFTFGSDSSFTVPGELFTGSLYSDSGAVTSNGTGSFHAVTYTGPILIDTEGNQTVIRSQPTGNPIIVQINGINTQFNTDGTLTLGSGGKAAGTQSVGGGASGERIWEGTSDPGVSAGEGDMWVDG